MPETTTKRRSIVGGRGRAARVFRMAGAVSLLIAAGLASTCPDNSGPSDAELARARGLTVELIKRLHNRRALPDEVIRRMSDEALNAEVEALDSDDGPKVSPAYNSPEAEASPAATPPASPRRRRRGGRASAASDAGAESPAPNKMSAAGWKPLGPDNVGGRTRSIVIDPARPGRIWAGSAGGGVWLSDDGGQSYRPVNDRLPSMSISCLALRPGEPGTIYAGTGEDFFFTVEGPRGAGILKIREDGSWEQLKGTEGADFRYVYRIAFSPDGGVLLAGTAGGLRRTADPSSGAWEQFPDLSFKVGEVVFDPRDGRNALAAGLENAEVFYSSDGGTSWNPAAHPAAAWSGRVVLAYARANPSVVYASVPTNPALDKDTTDEVWASSDGGRSFSKRGSMTPDEDGKLRPASYSPIAKFSSFIWADDPADEKLVVVGGIDIWRSTDGGDVLVPVSTSHELRPEDGKRPSTRVHIDQHCAAADPGYDGVKNRRVYFCNDGGIYRTDDIKEAGLNLSDRGVDWVPLNRTYAVTQFNGAAGDAGLGIILGGTQDNGTLFLAPGGGASDWVEAGRHTGDGGHCAIAPSDGFLFGTSPRIKIFRLQGKTPAEVQRHEYIYGVFFCGKEGEEPKFCHKPPPLLLGDFEARGANFVSPFLLDPNDERRLLAGGLSLWRTDEAKVLLTPTTGPRWFVIKEPVAGGSPINAVAVAQGNSNVIWVGHNNGDLFKTDSGAAAAPSWQKVDGGGPAPLPDRPCTRLVLDPRRPGVVFAAFGGYQPRNVWKTSDGGATWSPASEGLPAVPVLSLAVHPSGSGRMFAGTAIGVYASEDGGRWFPFGPTNAPVNQLFWMGDTLVAATYGRGMFSIALAP